MCADRRPADIPLEVSVQRPRAGVAVVRARGEVDAQTVPTLRSGLDTALTAATRDVALDLAGVEFMGSSGLSMLVEAQRAAAGRGGVLRLVAPSRAVLRPLELTGLLELFAVYPDATAALSDLGGPVTA